MHANSRQTVSLVVKLIIKLSSSLSRATFLAFLFVWRKLAKLFAIMTTSDNNIHSAKDSS